MTRTPPIRLHLSGRGLITAAPARGLTVLLRRGAAMMGAACRRRA